MFDGVDGDGEIGYVAMCCEFVKNNKLMSFIFFVLRSMVNSSKDLHHLF
jgi:hypothetical protein